MKGHSMQSLYLAILGEKSTAYYFKRFQQFDQQVLGLNASWNWSALFFGGFWALYRKMYGWFFLFWASAGLLKLFEIAGYSMFSYTVYITSSILFAIYGNSLYHNKIKTKITVAQFTIKDEQKLLEHLHYKGGVNIWVIWVSAALPVIGILSATLIPKLIAHPEYDKYSLEIAVIIFVLTVLFLIKSKYGKSIRTKMNPTSKKYLHFPISSEQEFGFFIRLCLILMYILALLIGLSLVYFLIIGKFDGDIWDSVFLLTFCLILGCFAHLGLFNKKRLDKIFEKFNSLDKPLF